MNYLRRRFIAVSQLLILTAFSSSGLAVDEDSGTLYELGLLNWLQYQKILLSDEVYEVNIRDSVFQTAELGVTLANGNVHGKVIFENQDDINHRIVFEQHVGNDLRYEIRSPVIKPGARWALEILRDGFYPFRCSIHAGKMQGLLRIRYEDDGLW